MLHNQKQLQLVHIALCFGWSTKTSYLWLRLENKFQLDIYVKFQYKMFNWLTIHNWMGTNDFPIEIPNSPRNNVHKCILSVRWAILLISRLIEFRARKWWIEFLCSVINLNHKFLGGNVEKCLRASARPIFLGAKNYSHFFENIRKYFKAFALHLFVLLLLFLSFFISFVTITNKGGKSAYNNQLLYSYAFAAICSVLSSPLAFFAHQIFNSTSFINSIVHAA